MKIVVSKTDYARLLLAICFWLIATNSVFAVVGIDYPQASPDVIFTGTSNQIIVTAVLKEDPNLIPNSVTAIRIGESSNALLGRLYDDGTHGDERAGDNIYSGAFPIRGAGTAGQIRLTVTAAYRANLRRVWSESFTIAVVNQPSAQELEHVTQAQRKGAEDYFAKRRTLGDEAARRSVVANLRKQPNVSDAGISSDGQTIWIRYTNGLEANILTSRPNTRGGLNQYLSHERRSIFWPSLASAINGSTCECTGSNSTEPKSKPVVLAPFFDQFSPYDESDEIAKLLSTTCLDSSLGGQVRAIKNSAVNLDTMKNLYQYNVIYTSTHGGVDSQGQVEITTREQATLVSRIKRFPDWFMGRITVVTVEGGASYWAINPKFVDYYAKGRFKKSLVFLSACLTFGADGTNQTLANAFKRNGASVYLGWQESVGSDFAYDTGIAFFNRMTDKNLAPGERNTGKAFDSINPKTEPKPQFATLTISGSRDVSLNLPQACPRIVVSSSLQLNPASSFVVGQNIKSTFNLTNRGSASIKLSTVLTGGKQAGSCPNNTCPNFSPQRDVTLAPNQTYSYIGTFTPTRAGSYTFSVAYQKPDGQWVIPAEKDTSSIANQLTINVTESKANVVVSSSLKISPNAAPLTPGQTVNGTFSITNRGNKALAMRQVLISGRVGDTCPNNICPDFSPINPNVTLNPGQTYNYSGRITLSQPGSYLFRVAYQTPDNKWEIPVKTENGTINQLPIVVQGALPTLTRRIPEVVFANPNYQFVNLYGTKLTGITYCTLKLPDGTKVFLYIPPGQVIKLGETQIRLKYKFLKRGTYYISASTLDGQSNEFPIIVN